MVNAVGNDRETSWQALKSGQNGIVGAFEGGGYMAEGIYRSQQNCIMFTRTRDFCAVCSEAIEKVIDEYTLSP